MPIQARIVYERESYLEWILDMLTFKTNVNHFKGGDAINLNQLWLSAKSYSWVKGG